jgi:methylated-DNA-[protein]-cysteine S-methyltransferase
LKSVDDTMRRPEFSSRVLSAVRRIPSGRVSTYGDVAEMAGRPRASRAVGNIMRNCSDSSIPCHRVIGAGGRLSGYGRDLNMKRALLAAEGVIVFGGIVKQFPEARWKR